SIKARYWGSVGPSDIVSVMYTLRVPFELVPGQAISNPDCEFRVGGRAATLSTAGYLYVLSISGFDTEYSAADYVVNVQAGLARLALDCGLAAAIKGRDVQPAQGDAAPSEVWGIKGFGVVHGDQPAVFRSDRKPVALTAQPAQVIHGRNHELVVRALQAG